MVLDTFFIHKRTFRLSLFLQDVQTEGISARQVSSTQSALLAIMCVTLSSCLAFTQPKLDVSARIAWAHDV